MKVCNSTDDMFEKSAGLQLIKFGLFDYIVEKFSFFDVLHDQKKMSGSFNNLSQSVFTS